MPFADQAVLLTARDGLADPLHRQGILAHECRRSPRALRSPAPQSPSLRSRGKGNDSSSMRSMNAPGSPSSPLQITYLMSLGACWAFCHLMWVGKPPPPRPRRPLRRTSSTILTGSNSCRQRRSAGKPVMQQVLVQIQRVDVATILGGNVLLRTQKGTDRLIPHIQRVSHYRIILFVGVERIEPARELIAKSPQEPSRTEVLQHNASHILRLHVRVEGRFAVRLDQLHQRRLVAHADAANGLDVGRRPRLLQDVQDFVVHVSAPLGLAARSQPDADFAARPAGAGRGGLSPASVSSGPCASRPQSRVQTLRGVTRPYVASSI